MSPLDSLPTGKSSALAVSRCPHRHRLSFVCSNIQVPVFWTVFLSKRVIGSYVGNRQDATEALALAASGKVKCLYKTLPASDLPQVYDDMHHGKVTGRIVLDMDKA